MKWQDILKYNRAETHDQYTQRLKDEALQRELSEIEAWANKYPSENFIGPRYIFIKIDDQRGGAQDTNLPNPDPKSGLYYIGKYTLEQTGLTKQELSQKIIQHIQGKGYITAGATDEEIPITKDLTSYYRGE